MANRKLSHEERVQRLRDYLKQISSDGEVEGARGELESASGGTDDFALESRSAGDDEESLAFETLDSLSRHEGPEDISDDGLLALEAVIHKTGRPAINIVQDTFRVPAGEWKLLGETQIRQRIEAAILSVGCVELPDDPAGRPYGGTGFIVGDDLLMTNRHVAEIFAVGLGDSGLRIRPGRTSAIDFRREIVADESEPELLKVLEVRMIHPYWDMALLKVAGLSQRLAALRQKKPALGDLGLKLAVDAPETLVGRNIVAIGYPAQDSRSDIQVQNQIFGGVFEVKRLLPGKFAARQQIVSFDQSVNAATHDSSTLGGNSGSLILDLDTGRVVGLHFAGEYLKSNYAVSPFDLAQDSRVVDAGVNFAGRLEPRGDFYGPIWAGLSRSESAGTNSPAPVADPFSTKTTQSVAPAPLSSSAAAVPGAGSSVTWTVPLQISISIGAPTVSPAALVPPTGAATRSEGMFSAARPAANWRLFDAASLRATRFDWKTALSLAYASRLAYENSVLVRDIATNTWGFSTCDFIEADDTQCFVASSSEAVLLSFRGTENLGDWLGNLNVIATTRPYGKVHRGFLGAFQVVVSELRSRLSSLAGRPLLVTGHSLGGALATVAAAEWQGAVPISWIYTYGQPAVGMGGFPAFVSQHHPGNFVRFVNDDDIVPRVPPAYRHVGRLLHFDARGNLQNRVESVLHEAANRAVPGLVASPSEPPMLTETQFDQLRVMALEQRNQARTEGRETPNLEGLLPSFSDHSLDNYIAKISLQIRN